MKTFLLLVFTAAIACADPAPLEKASAEMAAAANALLSSLDDSQREKALLPFDSDERENWHYIPKTRKGIPFSDLQPPQRDLALKLLRSGMSESGALKVETIITLESLLAEIENNPTYRDPGKYTVALFGVPAPAATWAWRFEGHHVAVNFTLVEGKAISATPSFLGANPAEVRDGRLKGTRPLAREEDLARTLAAALHEAGKPVIFSEKPPEEILTAADRKARQLDPVGLPGAEMTASQKDGLLTLISEYAHRHRREVAEKDLAKIKADLDRVRFGWAGSLAPGKAYYYRVQGESFLIEAANTQNNANHIHTVWRDLEGDFARDTLGDHMHHHTDDH